MRTGHIPGTGALETPNQQGVSVRQQDRTSSVPGWPRLLHIEQAAAYLGVSVWTIREFLNDGSIPTVALPRPNTARMRKRRPVNDTVRRLLIDRSDLDGLVERWKQRA